MYAASDGHVRTAPVGSFPLGITPNGVLDLAGNVAEWVDGTLSPVARGGSYADTDRTRVASMDVRSGDVAGPSVGFRCAADH
jgi:formylglycine-generating enzyme required for sulfatase activity